MEIIDSAANNSLKKIINNYRDTHDFLSKYSIPKNVDLNSTNPKPITNTRIPEIKLNIHGGKYSIPDEEYETFLQLYALDVILKKKKEYLTEKQLDNGGPLLIDIDFRYEYEIDEKQHQFDDIKQLIGGYLDELKNIYQLDEDSEFPIFVFEKPTVNRIDDKVKNKKYTKDGIHMLFGLQVDNITQLMIREKMIQKVVEIWEKLPLTNSWEDVFDKGISAGTTAWQLYGSRKPNNEKYQLIHIFQAKWDGSDFIFPEIPLSSFDVVKNINKLSVRYKDNLLLFMKNEFIKEYEQYKIINRLDGSSGAIKSNGQQALTSIVRNAHLDIYNNDFLNPSNIAKINSKQELDKFINNFLDSIQVSDYNLREMYDYVMILPESYYGQSSYNKWISVGWILKNTDNRLLLAWIAFSAKSSTFHYSSDIPDLCERWNNFDIRKDGLTKRSLLNWAKTDAFEAYEKVRNKTVEYFLEKTIRTNNASSKSDDRSGCGDTDIAKVLYELYKHMHVCVSIRGNDWYQFIDNRWCKVDSGTTLRRAISEQLRDLYNDKSSTSMENMVVQPGKKLFGEKFGEKNI